MTGVTHMLMLHQATLVPAVKSDLMCQTMQLHDNGLGVNDKPKYMVSEPAEAHNATTMLMDSNDSLVTPLSLTRAMTHFLVRMPTREEWECLTAKAQVELTADSPNGFHK